MDCSLLRQRRKIGGEHQKGVHHSIGLVGLAQNGEAALVVFWPEIEEYFTNVGVE